MTLNHVHLQVCDLQAALDWIRNVWQTEPAFTDNRLAVVPFGALTVIFDLSDKDSPATLGFESTDCDADYRAAVQRGAVPIDPPADRPWGTRAAYVRGPGAVTFELE